MHACCEAISIILTYMSPRDYLLCSQTTYLPSVGFTYTMHTAESLT